MVFLSIAEHYVAPTVRHRGACPRQLRRFGLVESITFAVVSMTLAVGWNGPCTALCSP
jgi:hypothetical protein